MDLNPEVLSHTAAAQNLLEAVLNQAAFLHLNPPFKKGPMVTALVEILNQEVFPMHLILLQNLAIAKLAAALLNLREIITAAARDLFFPYQFPYPGDITQGITGITVFYQPSFGGLLNL
ncbi:hypothetical protein ACYUJ6_16190 [Clostridium sp. JNZ X4-2]